MWGGILSLLTLTSIRPQNAARVLRTRPARPGKLPFLSSNNIFPGTVTTQCVERANVGVLVEHPDIPGGAGQHPFAVPSQPQVLDHARLLGALAPAPCENYARKVGEASACSNGRGRLSLEELRMGVNRESLSLHFKQSQHPRIGVGLDMAVEKPQTRIVELYQKRVCRPLEGL